MKKIVCLFFFVLGLVGCSNQTLIDDYDEDTLKSSAQWGVEQLNAGNYEEVANIIRSDLQAQLNSEVIEQA